MQGYAARQFETQRDELPDIADLEETAALPALVLPDAEAANASSAAPAMPEELEQHLERLIQLGESINRKLGRIARSLENCIPASPRRATKSRAGATRKKAAKP